MGEAQRGCLIFFLYAYIKFSKLPRHIYNVQSRDSNSGAMLTEKAIGIHLRM